VIRSSRYIFIWYFYLWPTWIKGCL